MLGIEQLDLSVQVAAVLVPAAVYFLLLGLLNSQRAPQLLRARSDFILLVAAFFPIFCVPVLSYLGATAWTVLIVVGLGLAAATLLAPSRRGSWVIYNIALPEALRAAERALQAMGEPFTRTGRRLRLGRRKLSLRFTALPMLRNVSIAADGQVLRHFQRDFEAQLGGQLAGIRAGATPMGATFLLLATAMLVAPLALVANRMPEMVRILTDLIR